MHLCIIFIFDMFSSFLDTYTLGYECKLFLQLVFVQALLYMILKAHAISFFVILLLASLSVAQAQFSTIHFINVQVVLLSSNRVTELN